MSESNLKAYVNNSFIFSSRLIPSNFSSILFVFRWFFTWIALADVDLRASIIVVTKANYVAWGTTLAACFLSPIINSHTWLMAWKWCHFLQASNTSAATDRLAQIALNRKVSRKFLKIYKCSRRVNAKSRQKNCVKRDLPVNMSLVDGFAELGSVTLNMEIVRFSVNSETSIMLDSGKVPEDHHLSKICRGKINIVRENVIC